VSADIEITQGADEDFFIRLTQADGDPIDLADVTAASVCFEAEGSQLEVSLVATPNGSVITKEAPESIGKLKVSLDDLDTLTLKARVDKDLELSATISGKKRIILFKQAHTVIAKICD